jgi:hypothetical protein
MQALMVYFQFFQIIKELPISWMPSPVEGVQEQLFTRGGLATIYSVLSGRMASLDCLFQAWQLWQGTTIHEIAVNLFMRGCVR